MRPSQVANAQTRVPPSNTPPLPPRNGPLSVIRPGAGPPLSLEKDQRVGAEASLVHARADLPHRFIHRRDHARVGAARFGHSA